MSHIETKIIRYFLPIFVMVSLLFQIACSEKLKSSDSLKNTTIETKTTSVSSDIKSVHNRGYVKQSKKISNGIDYGIEVLAVRRTANNYMLDFRFKITDTEKAKYIMQRKIKAHLTIEKDNSKLVVPVSYKLGALRQSGNNLKTNKNYFMFFANPGGHVKKDDLVTIEIAGFKAEHVIVN